MKNNPFVGVNSIRGVFVDRNRGLLVAFVCLLSIFSQEFFFIFSGAIGFEYNGISDSPVYVRYIVIVFSLTMSVYAFSIMVKPGVLREELVIYLYFIFLMLNHGVWAIIDSQNVQLFPDNLIFFLSMGVVGFFSARSIHALKVWRNFIRLSELVFFFLALGIIYKVIASYYGGFFVLGIGGQSYQAVSYYSAVCFGMLGYANFRLETELRFVFFCGKLALLINVLVMLFLAMSCILNGGRGAFILLCIYATLIFYWVAMRNSRTVMGVYRFFAFLMFFIVGGVFALQMIQGDFLLAKGFNRALSFIGSSEDGIIDLAEGSSNRDVVYEEALDGIAASPIVGFGAFSSWEKVTVPHNIFLDLFLQFGVPIASVLIVFVVVALWKMRNPLTPEKLWLLVLSLYPAVMLMFSGGYLRSALFWFVLSSWFFLGSYMPRSR